MSIFKQKKTEKKKVEPAVRIANRMKKQTVGMIEHLVQARETLNNFFWNNPNATNKEIAKELGNDAQEIFNMMQELEKFLVAVNPDLDFSAPEDRPEFTFTKAGKMTIK